ncbi:hypothetical protein CSC35_4895 [Enterobacter hormaechei]|nr:hypothetical protein CSC35_4895 [Enterobacter hormaechei]
MLLARACALLLDEDTADDLPAKDHIQQCVCRQTGRVRGKSE